MQKQLLERFIRYVKFDTQSDPERASQGIHPSTDKQWDLLRLLEKELKEMGLKDVILHKNGLVIARLEGNVEGAPCIGFMAHVDTAPDVSGRNVNPQIIENYDGKDVNLGTEYVLRAADNPELAGYVGETIITTDGSTLLGADDKAGVTEIMEMLKHFVEHPEKKHGTIEVMFTTDEETGAGMDIFPYDEIKSEYCYTLDGGTRYEVELECFNAVTMKLHFKGISYHLGAARGRLVNALTMAAKVVSMLPQNESPEATDGRYGYYCPSDLNGDNTEATLSIVLRDFDLDEIKRKISVVESIARAVENIYPGGQIEVSHKFSYYNMNEVSKSQPRVLDGIFESGKKLGMPIKVEIIRGGTDGARMANERNIPCPNLFTGGHNFHSRFEWCALPAMEDAVKLAIGIVEYGCQTK